MKRNANRSGGSAAGGGFNFQAALGAIAGVHALRGTPVLWTDGLSASPPCSISFETGGPGDDISLELADGSTVEIQARKGLRADRQRFWPALDALCEGIAADRCSYGILIVCPHSSVPVRKGYASACRRIGEGRNDGASVEQTELFDRLLSRGYDPAKICARIRIRTVSALNDEGDAIAAARSELAHICADHQLIPAWHTLCQDALSAIENRGRRNVRTLSGHLSACGIDLEGPAKDSPATISQALVRLTMSQTEHFQVLGISRPLPTDRAWLPLTASVRDASIEPTSAAEKALADYQAVSEKSSTDRDAIDASTIGTFRKLCVVVGGPGCGKSLLLKRVAREFAKDSHVSIHVRLRDLAKRIQEKGSAVEEGLFQLGLDGTEISPEKLRAASVSDLVILCDGLDECGHYQDVIASGLQNISACHPSYRIVVTTRPIGYTTTQLHGWRHYEIKPLAKERTAEHLATICRGTLECDSEDPEQLLPRIRAYLEEGSATRILARSPLLLAFGAALFLRWKNPSGTKTELYQRIFHLIDEAPIPRKAGTEPPERAVRNSVLHQLGWLIAASPLSTSEELERRCAETLERAIGGTRLQTLSAVQASIAYWEEAGLIERLRHSGLDLVAFIHKTCGEFAAALHLSAMQPDEARGAIATALENPDWDEILEFATHTSLATTVAQTLLGSLDGSELNQATLNGVFRVLARPETCLSPAERKSFLSRAFTLARSEDRQKAYGVGRCLTKHDLSHMPEVEGMARSLVSDTAEWSQLIGWGVLACHFPSSVHRSDLEDALHQFVVRSRDEDFFVLRESGSRLGVQPDRRVFENFLIAALKSLLPGQDVEYQDRVIADVGQLRRFVTMRFLDRFDALFKQLGREDVSGLRLWSAGKWPRVHFPFAEYDKASCALLTDVVPAAFLREPVVPVRTGPKCLAALFRMAGILDTAAPDVYVWVSERTQLPAVHALLRAAAYVFDLPTERLAAEAAEIRATVRSLRRDGKSSLSVLPDVDVGEINWDRARDVDIQTDVLERLVHHPSEWVQHVAAMLLVAQVCDAECLNVCERLLTKGTGNTLYFASTLAAASPSPHGEELILDRLRGPAVPGLHYLFGRLKDNDWRVTATYLPVLENGLIQCDAKTAVSAAQCCEATASTADTWLVPLLRSATSYWIKNEEPYPTEGGVIPDSPREALLRTLCRISPPSFEELTALARDSRSDVANAAIDEILRQAVDSRGVRSQLVQNIVAKQFSPRQCERLIDSSVSFAEGELSTLCDLCDDAEPAYRVFALRRVLVHPIMDRERSVAIAVAMKADEDGNIRDAVYQLLDREI